MLDLLCRERTGVEEPICGVSPRGLAVRLNEWRVRWSLASTMLSQSAWLGLNIVINIQMAPPSLDSGQHDNGDP